MSLDDKALKTMNEIAGALYLMSLRPEALKDGVGYQDLTGIGVLSGAEFLLEKGCVEKFRTNDIMHYRLTEKGQEYLKERLGDFPSD